MKKMSIFLSLGLVFFMVGTLGAASITVTKPAANENWVKGQTYTITWTKSSGYMPPDVKITLRDKNSTSEILVIAETAPNSGSYQWLVPASIANGEYRVRVKVKASLIEDDSDVFTISSPGPLTLTSPNGGESWPLGSTREITWNPGSATGTVSLDLYKGGTKFENKVGTITSNTPAGTGKFKWTVGSFLHKEVSPQVKPGDDYFIVISSYTPQMKDASNGPFTIAQAKIKPSDLPPIVKCFALTNPRRGDLWYKTGKYTIKWTKCPNMGEEPFVRIDLMKNDGTTLVGPIVNALYNVGSYDWIVPQSLPDEETFYKMRIQTVDGKYSDIVGPIRIGKPPTPPKVIKVITPVSSAQLTPGGTYTIKWTSGCINQQDPTVDLVSIELTNFEMTTVKTLLEKKTIHFDALNPDGSRSWHWDWTIYDYWEHFGKHRIKVISHSGNCSGIGEPFQIIYP